MGRLDSAGLKAATAALEHSVRDYEMRKNWVNHDRWKPDSNARAIIRAYLNAIASVETKK